MIELTQDKFYKILTERYNKLLLDYVLLSYEEEYYGIESHKSAVVFSISIFNTRVRVGNSLKHPDFYVDKSKMQCIKCDTDSFFNEDINGWIVTSPTTSFRETPESTKMNYWDAFSNPPYRTPYTKEDFQKINYMLFPVQYRNDLEIYSWNDDFSNYFDDGKEWWGAALWSIYDKWMKRFVIIGASLTD